MPDLSPVVVPSFLFFCHDSSGSPLATARNDFEAHFSCGLVSFDGTVGPQLQPWILFVFSVMEACRHRACRQSLKNASFTFLRLMLFSIRQDSWDSPFGALRLQAEETNHDVFLKLCKLQRRWRALYLSLINTGATEAKIS